jgi:hypothetical protein
MEKKTIELPYGLVSSLYYRSRLKTFYSLFGYLKGISDAYE